MISCKAINEKSIYVTATGEILPCSFMCIGDAKVTSDIKNIIKGENFSDLTDTWESKTPFNRCFVLCDDRMSHHPMNMVAFKKQWKIKNISD
jgi:hypothetical protein